MIETYKDISCINQTTTEGQLLMMTLAILTTINYRDIDENKWGATVHPDIALRQVVELTNKIYYEEEWNQYQAAKLRDDKINEILDE